MIPSLEQTVSSRSISTAWSTSSSKRLVASFRYSSSLASSNGRLLRGGSKGTHGITREVVASDSCGRSALLENSPKIPASSNSLVTLPGFNSGSAADVPGSSSSSSSTRGFGEGGMGETAFLENLRGECAGPNAQVGISRGERSDDHCGVDAAEDEPSETVGAFICFSTFFSIVRLEGTIRDVSGGLSSDWDFATGLSGPSAPPWNSKG